MSARGRMLMTNFYTNVNGFLQNCNTFVTERVDLTK